MLDPRIVQDLRNIQKRLTPGGKLPPLEKLQHYYGAFEERFGPDRLSSLDGEALLVTMKGLIKSNRDTMAYWLEFKNDDEFPAIFGSIGGGSAYKWGVYADAETGDWMRRGAGNKPKRITLDEAISVARTHREQIFRGVDLLRQLPAHATDQDYVTLQAAMDKQAPDVSTVMWGHKYFSLLFPDKLDDYHVPEYQRFHLVRLLQPDIPPAKAGRYVTAGRYVALAAELEMPINHLDTILNERTGRPPYNYWCILANNHGGNAKDLQLWPLFVEKDLIAAQGWANVGDLSTLSHNQTSRDELSKRMAQASGTGAAGRWAQELFSFVTHAEVGDLVLAMDLDTVLGVGRITGGYRFATEPARAPHQRSVEWLNTESWELAIVEGHGSSFRAIKNHVNQVEAERRLLSPTPLRPLAEPKLQPATGQIAQIEAILERKGQVILYGPPGTGKTFVALNAVRELAARSVYQKPFSALASTEQVVLQEPSSGFVRVVTFHPGYGYEDFIEGYRPHTIDESMHFELRDGIFKRLCADAAAQPSQKYFLVIDEINRGDIPRIFGELLTLLEKDKRSQVVTLPVSGDSFVVPLNVFVVATMNTADRSIALLDTALRRRFGFIELMPDTTMLNDTVIEGVPIGPWLQALNARIVTSIGRDARNLQVGHAYLLEGGKPITDFGRFVRVLQEDLVPLLEEYCYEDYTALEQILGGSLVNSTEQRVRHELFSPAQRDDLLRALLELTPELTTMAQAVSAKEEPDQLAEDESTNGEA